MTNEWRGVPGGDWPEMLAQVPATAYDENGTAQRSMTATKAAKKTGSSMSDKQIARAAVQGQRLIFRTVAFTPMDGYVVGMDDFHWLIASPGELGEPVATTLIHKTCPLVSFTDTYLADEPDEDRTAIQRIGRPFWESCVRLGLARAISNQEPHQ